MGKMENGKWCAKDCSMTGVLTQPLIMWRLLRFQQLAILVYKVILVYKGLFGLQGIFGLQCNFGLQGNVNHQELIESASVSLDINTKISGHQALTLCETRQHNEIYISSPRLIPLLNRRST